jgi:hypothetical protein
VSAGQAYDCQQRKLLEENEKKLLQLQQQLVNGSKTWGEINGASAPATLVSPPAATRSSKRLKAASKKQPQQDEDSNEKGHSDAWIENWENGRKQQTSPIATGRDPSAAASTSNDAATGTGMDEDAQSQTEEAEVTAASSEAARNKEAEKVLKKASSGVSEPHLKGQAGSDIRHASDRQSNAVVHIAMKAAAYAADTVRVQDLQVESCLWM